MPDPVSRSFKLEVPDAGTVTAKMDAPATPAPGAPALVLAHGANNDLDYPLLAYVAEHLATAIGVAGITRRPAGGAGRGGRSSPR